MARRYIQKQRPTNAAAAAAAVILNLLFHFHWKHTLQVDAASLLDPHEVTALHEIAKELRKTDWNFAVDPCSGNDSSWSSQPNPNYKVYVNQLNCTCSGGLCHVVNISLKGQDLAGVLPKSLPKLPHLQRMYVCVDLSRNYLNGSIPREWASMHALQFLSLSVNRLSGPIPAYLGDIITLTYLSIESNMFSGPVPPELGKLVNLQNLTLSANNLTGHLPNALTNLSKLTELDLSFNNLVGSMPDDPGYSKVNYMYLTNNFLNGPVPGWVSSIGVNNYIDLSYNNFNQSSLPPSCSKDNLNLYRSSSRELNSSLAACLEQNLPCLNHRYSLHIDCGGNGTKVGKHTTYEADDDSASPAKFHPNKAGWGYSSTGHFWSTSYNGDYIAANDTPLEPVADPNLYTEARISALSLTYYGRCLAKGNYTVVLYFAEIQFTNNNSYHRLGRRLFDIYIQEKLVVQDFDIVKAANGSEKVCNVTAGQVSITQTGTIEIRLYYAGKGTTAVPSRGTYGPLISAISVKSEFRPPPDKKRIIEIAVGSLASVILLVIIAYAAFVRWRRQRNIPSREEVLQGIDLQTGLFTYLQIKAATDNFDPENKIGEGGFGSVYRGTLLDGTYIAVKKLSSKSSQGNKEFVTEIRMLSGLHHPNLVRLYGCCVEGAQLFLVYEYMVNNNLARALFDEDWPLRLDWPTRQKVCTEIAKGLQFLHEESAIRIIHRDIKPTNVLLDENLDAKISDFGLARLREEEDTHISTRVAGTMGYMSPEYALWGYLTYKADVYSFGVVALEIVAGKSNMDFVPDEHNFCLLDCAIVQQKRGELTSIIDAKLGNEYNKEEAVRMVKIALLCTNASPALRPTMSQVVRMLQGDLSVEDTANDPDAYVQLPISEPLQIEPADLVSETQSLIHSSDAPATGSSSTY